MNRSLIILLFLSVNISKAQSVDTLIEDTKLKKQINEVVVTGQINELSIKKSVHKIRVIDSKIINSGLYQNLANVIEKELNIKLSEDNLLGSSLSIQGISGQNVKILIDNVPVIGRLNGNIDISQISLNNIEKIEIVEGPLSTVYGTDALAGTINLITKKNSDEKKISTFYESVGRYNIDVLIAQNKKHNMSYNFGRKYFNGWSENQDFIYIPKPQPADTNRYKTWKPKEQFFHKVSYRIKNKDVKWSTQYEMFNEKITNLGRPTEPYFESAFDEYFYTYRKNIGSNISFKNNKDKINIILAYNKYKRIKETYFTDLITLDRNLIENSDAQDTSRFSLLLAKMTFSSNKNNKIQYQTGIELEKQTAKGKRIMESFQEQYNFAFFSTAEYTGIKNIILRPSFRIIKNSNFDVPIIPAFNVMYNTSNTQIRLNYANGFRDPDFKELYLDFVDVNHNITGNPQLDPEKSKNIQLSISNEKNKSRLKIKSNVSLFYNSITNKIDLTNTIENPYAYSYFNIETYKTKGISAYLNFAHSKFNLKIGSSYIGRMNKIISGYELDKFNFAIDYNLSSIINISKTTKLNIFYKNTGSVSSFYIENNQVNEYISEAYNIMDISINQRFYNTKLIVALGIKNLFNVKDINRSMTNKLGHSSSTSMMPIGYGTSFTASINFEI